ncbi:MAG: alpha/beta hydrolase [Bdellovibrionales bacterium]
MKQIYFAGSQGGVFKRGMKATLNYVTTVLDQGLPTLSLLWAERLLCSPVRPRRRASLEATGFQAHNLRVYGHQIRIYAKGDLRRAVVFVHGWSGAATNFQSFFDPYLEAGYGVIAFDHVAHGRSSGKVSNFFLFIRGLEAVLDWVEARTGQVEGIVAHSMGASTVISALRPEHQKIPLVFLAPVVPFFESLYASVQAFGVASTWVTRLIVVFEQRYGLLKEEVDPKERLGKIFNPILIVHDQADTYIDLKINLPHLPKRYADVRVTEGLGHFRLLKNSQVVSDTVQFIQHD